MIKQSLNSAFVCCEELQYAVLEDLHNYSHPTQPNSVIAKCLNIKLRKIPSQVEQGYYFKLFGLQYLEVEYWLNLRMNFTFLMASSLYMYMQTCNLFS